AARDAYTRGVLGVEYAFENTLTLGVEYYWNGEGTIHRSDYDFARLFAGEIQNLAQHYTGAHLRYDVTPLLRSENHLILNHDDASLLFAPSLVYSLTSDWDAIAGMQWFSGDTDSEYGRFHNVYYMYLQRFF
ncbi:MAG: hypothetical protein FD130_1741, partial [Halothiobacillaceae bacterium]